MQPPYLLFYPDKNDDDVPDGDPEVLLSGFGMDDTHSLRQLAAVGPGRLALRRGRQHRAPARSRTRPTRRRSIEFQQGIWRYHPKTKRFELFSEGGGNTYGLDFDKHGQVIAGTNWGGFAMLHQMQGAYYVKGFAKHGPLHNPHTYGYFDHVPYTGFKGGHVTCGGIVYQADAYPKEFRDQYIAGEPAVERDLLAQARAGEVVVHGEARRRAARGERPRGSARSICLLGPDGCVYVADLYDQRAAHLDPVDNWDKTNGRIYRIEYKGGPKYETFDLREEDVRRAGGVAEAPEQVVAAGGAATILDRAAGQERPPEAAEVAADREGQTRARSALDALRVRRVDGARLRQRRQRTRTSTSARGRCGSSWTTAIIPEQIEDSTAQHGRERDEPGGAGATRLLGAAAATRGGGGADVAAHGQPADGGRPAPAAADVVGARVREHGRQDRHGAVPVLGPPEAPRLLQRARRAAAPVRRHPARRERMFDALRPDAECAGRHRRRCCAASRRHSRRNPLDGGARRRCDRTSTGC